MWSRFLFKSIEAKRRRASPEDVISLDRGEKSGKGNLGQKTQWKGYNSAASVLDKSMSAIAVDERIVWRRGDEGRRVKANKEQGKGKREVRK